jgi:hypothetical protein
VRFLVELLATLAIALVLGLGSAWYMVEAPRIGTEVGSWRAIPAVTAETADPYTRARIARTGEIAMGAGEGLMFIASQDDQGRGLDGACDYRLAGETPPARLWTLSVVDGDGGLTAAPTGRTHMTSREILRAPDGRFEIAVSASARPGNWLPSPARGGERLMLRLYDTPIALSPGADMAMPRIVRGTCR